MKKFVMVITLILCAHIPMIAQGENLFDDSRLHEIRFYQMDTTLLDGRKEYQRVDMIFDGQAVDSVGIKGKGNISANVPNLKVPLKVKTNKYVSGQKYDKIKEFTLHNNYQDPTMMREKLTYELCADLGLLALRTAYAKVYINDKYWGLYTIVEGKDEMFKQRFDHRDADAVESLDFGIMCHLSNDPNEYNYEITHQPTYQLENGDANTAFPRFADMIDKANNTTDAEYLEVVSKVLNLKDFFTYQAANVYLMNFDSYIGYNGNQIYMYDTLAAQWQVIPWDFNASLNLWDDGNGQQHADAYPILPERITSGCIADKLNTIPSLKEYYMDAMCRLANTLADPVTINNKIDVYKNQIREAVHSDWRKTFSNDEFDAAIEYGEFTMQHNSFEGLKTFFEERSALIKQGLEANDYSCMTSSTDIEHSTLENIRLYPNPASEHVYINSELDISSISIWSMDGKLQLQYNSPNQSIDISDLAEGIYIAKINSGEKSISRKFLKM